jgi:hypothetical protein
MYAIFNKSINDFVKDKRQDKTLILQYSISATQIAKELSGQCFVVPIRDLEDYKLELDYHIQELNETIEKLTYGNNGST